MELSGQLRPDAEGPHLAEDHDVAAERLQALAQALQEAEGLSQRMVDAEGIHAHAHQALGLFDHERHDLGVLQVELGQVAEAQEGDELIGAVIQEGEPIMVLAAVLQQRLGEHRSLVPAMVGHEVADNAQPLGVGLVQQLLVVVPRAEVRIHLVHIQGVVAVIVLALVDGREHDGVEPQVLDIVEFRDDAL